MNKLRGRKSWAQVKSIRARVENCKEREARMREIISWMRANGRTIIPPESEWEKLGILRKVTIHHE